MSNEWYRNMSKKSKLPRGFFKPSIGAYQKISDSKTTASVRVRLDLSGVQAWVHRLPRFCPLELDEGAIKVIPWTGLGRLRYYDRDLLSTTATSNTLCMESNQPRQDNDQSVTKWDISRGSKHLRVLACRGGSNLRDLISQLAWFFLKEPDKNRLLS